MVNHYYASVGKSWELQQLRKLVRQLRRKRKATEKSRQEHWKAFEVFLRRKKRQDAGRKSQKRRVQRSETSKTRACLLPKATGEIDAGQSNSAYHGGWRRAQASAQSTFSRSITGPCHCKLIYNIFSTYPELSIVASYPGYLQNIYPCPKCEAALVDCSEHWIHGPMHGYGFGASSFILGTN